MGFTIRSSQWATRCSIGIQFRCQGAHRPRHFPREMRQIASGTSRQWPEAGLAEAPVWLQMPTFRAFQGRNCRPRTENRRIGRSVLAKRENAPSLRAGRAVFHLRRQFRHFCFADCPVSIGKSSGTGGIPETARPPPGRRRKPVPPDIDEASSAPRRILIPAAKSRISGWFRSARRSAPAPPGIMPTAP